MKAHEETISLSATGFYSTTDYYYDWEKHTGKPFIYHTFGTSVSEVEIDCLTGDHQIRRTDIVMDIGKREDKHYFFYKFYNFIAQEIA